MLRSPDLAFGTRGRLGERGWSCGVNGLREILSSAREIELGSRFLGKLGDFKREVLGNRARIGGSGAGKSGSFSNFEGRAAMHGSNRAVGLADEW
jgi:hypothetical protein